MQCVNSRHPSPALADGEDQKDASGSPGWAMMAAAPLFVPPPEIRRARDLTRTRCSCQDRTRELAAAGRAARGRWSSCRRVYSALPEQDGRDITW